MNDDTTCNGRYIALGELVDLLYFVAFYYGVPTGDLDGVHSIPPKGGFHEGLQIRNQAAFKELDYLAQDIDRVIKNRVARLKRLVNDN